MIFDFDGDDILPVKLPKLKLFIVLLFKVFKYILL